MDLADSNRPGLLILGEDFEVDRWAAGDRDSKGNLIWHDGRPELEQWNTVRMVTVDYDPAGEGNYRNIPISPDEPLDPYARPDLAKYGPEYFYDIEDLATQYQWYAFSP